MTEQKLNALRLIIEGAITCVALECVARQGTPKGTVLSPTGAAREEAKRIIAEIKKRETS